MDVQEYLQRIGFQGPHDKPDLATLRQMHKRHIMSIPFENLSIHSGERTFLDVEVAFNKLVRSKRGGVCMENNLLFSWAMRELGYDFTILGAKIFNGNKNEFGHLDSHLITKVVIDEKEFICDVAFGMASQMWYPLELISGKDQPQNAGVFRMMDKGDFWVLERNKRTAKFLNPDVGTSYLVDKNDIVTMYRFTLTPRDLDHFLPANEGIQSNPSSMFMKMSLCSLQTETGFRALIGWTYSEVASLPEEGVNVLDVRLVVDDDMEKILKEKFNVVLKNKFQVKGRSPTEQKGVYPG